MPIGLIRHRGPVPRLAARAKIDLITSKAIRKVEKASLAQSCVDWGPLYGPSHCVIWTLVRVMSDERVNQARHVGDITHELAYMQHALAANFLYAARRDRFGTCGPKIVFERWIADKAPIQKLRGSIHGDFRNAQVSQGCPSGRVKVFETREAHDSFAPRSAQAEPWQRAIEAATQQSPGQEAATQRPPDYGRHSKALPLQSTKKESAGLLVWKAENARAVELDRRMSAQAAM